MFEQHTQALLTKDQFFRRFIQHVAIAFGFLAMSLAGGAAGYHLFAGLPWVDAVLNAAMILTGMGPVDVLHSNQAKIFASCYAIYSGVAFLTVMAIVFAPLVHRLLHRFHLDEGD